VLENGLVEGIFLRVGTIHPKIFLSGDDDACALFPSWRCHFWRVWSSCVVLVVVVLLLLGLEHRSGCFIFLVSFFWLCASILPLGYCIVVEAGCNWYNLDINIYSLSKKMYVKRGRLWYRASRFYDSDSLSTDT
jgi:hypothetical protein